MRLWSLRRTFRCDHHDTVSRDFGILVHLFNPFSAYFLLSGFCGDVAGRCWLDGAMFGFRVFGGDFAATLFTSWSRMIFFRAT